MAISTDQFPPPYTVEFQPGNRATGTMDVYRVMDSTGAAVVSIPTYTDLRTEEFLQLAVDALNVAFAATQAPPPGKQKRMSSTVASVSETPDTSAEPASSDSTSTPTPTDSSDFPSQGDK